MSVDEAVLGHLPCRAVVFGLVAEVRARTWERCDWMMRIRMTCRKQSCLCNWYGGHSRAAALKVVDSLVNPRRAVFGHSSTTSVPFMFLWPKPQTLEQ